MGDEGALAQQQEGCQGGAHAALLALFLPALEDSDPSQLRGVFQHREDVVRCDAIFVAYVRIQQVLARLHRVAKICDRDLRGDLARGMATHPVGDSEQRQLLVDEKVVLVALSPPTNVGRSPETQLHSVSCKVPGPPKSSLNSIYPGDQQELARQDSRRS